ncbi:hypothetical protein [Actibacterium ureilyticum]|uniref:hypothetical protein n=1 Tax=Actibacterium ureilyticum TaxID=1590614 RepID=UPI001140C834|nr:hypothetical protein [Actibacterium ureilyticum]
MRLDEKDVCELVSMAYAAGLDSRKWEWFLARLSRVAGGIRVFAHVFDLKSASGLGLIQHGFDPSFVNSFSDYYAQLNPWAQRFGALPVGQVIASDRIVDPRALKKTEFYADWIRPQGDITNSGGAILINDADQVVAFGSCIREKDIDRLEPHWLALAQLLVPHLQNAFRINNQIGTLGLENRIYREGMEPGTTAIIALDRTGRLKFRNDRGALILERGDLLTLSLQGRVRFADPGADRVLSRALYNIDLEMAPIAAPFFVTDARGSSFACRAIPFRNPEDLPLPFPGPVRLTETLLILLTPCALKTSPGTAQAEMRNF